MLMVQQGVRTGVCCCSDLGTILAWLLIGILLARPFVPDDVVVLLRPYSIFNRYAGCFQHHAVAPATAADYQ